MTDADNIVFLKNVIVILKDLKKYIINRLNTKALNTYAFSFNGVNSKLKVWLARINGSKILNFFKGCLVDQGSYNCMSRKSSDLRLFLRAKSVERRRSRKYDDEDDEDFEADIVLCKTHANRSAENDLDTVRASRTSKRVRCKTEVF